MRVKLTLASAGIALAAMAITGCGGDDNETTPAGGATAPSPGAQTVNVSETEYKLDPSDPTVQAGTVSFKATNDGSVDHNLEVEGPEGEQELEQNIAPGESGTLTVDLSKPGKYEFYCPVDGHRGLGMEGEIAVTGGGDAGGGGGNAGGGDGSAGGGGAAGGGGGGGYGY
jgi:uncharacterized cupredoxin-like copper-binding protein